MSNDESQNKLPPLPPPQWPREYFGGVPSGAYSADQMHAYARAALDQFSAPALEPVATLWREQHQELYPGPLFDLTEAGKALPLGVKHKLYATPVQAPAPAPEVPAENLPTKEHIRELAQEALDQIMEQAQVFASAWSLVGGPFDSGSALDDANDAKDELRTMVRSLADLAAETVRPAQCAAVGAELVGYVTSFGDVGGTYDYVSPQKYRPPVGALLYAVKDAS